MRIIHLSLILIFLFFTACTQSDNPVVIMETEFGKIVIEIFEEQAPLTSANFLRYVDEERLVDAVFYRVVTLNNQEDHPYKIKVLQGGLFEDEHPMMLAGIKHENTEETGILHKDGVISLARLEPGTATSEFFICIGDQPELDFGGRRNPDGYGFAAFGKVIKGMNVVREIQQLPETNQMLNKPIKITLVQRQ